MKQVNFNHPGGFPLEQETLERLQTAYRTELFGALKSHLGINPDNDYIVAQATSKKKGWAIIRQEGEGILYPIQIGTPTNFLKTTRTGTNLTYGTGKSQTAYFDYEAQYITPEDYANRQASPITDALAVHYYDLKNPVFIVIKDIKTIEGILDSIEAKIKAIQANIGTIDAEINSIKQSYLPLDGSMAMKGDLNLDIYQLSKLDIKESTTAKVRVTDFRLGSALGRALVDGRNQSSKSLSLNYQSDWENTNIGGKVFLNNINTSNTGSLLVIDNANQVTKSNTLIDSLLNRITALENKPTTAVPIGMIAIWGKSAPFPKGWEEYVPLRGRMPIGLDINDQAFNTLLGIGGNKEKILQKENIPALDVTLPTSSNDNSGGNASYVNATDVDYAFDKKYLDVVNKGNVIKAINILNPYRVVHFIEYTGNITEPADSIAPTGLKVTNIGTTSVTLSWNASTDNVGITNYLVYKDNGNTPLAELGKDVLTYNVSGLTASTAYDFYVIAKDAAGNLSKSSNIVNAITKGTDEIPPTSPKNIRSFLKTNDQITIEWDPSTDNVGIAEYQVWRKIPDEDYRLSARTLETNATFYGEPYKTYYFKVRAVDAAGNLSDFTNEISEATMPVACFDVESLVTMASGESKKLRDIIVGDKLQGLTFPNEIDEAEGDYMLWSGKLNEGTKAEVTVVNKKTSIQPNYYEIKTADATIKVTGEHPLLISEDRENVQYVCTKNITQNMFLVDKTGETKPIESILFKEEPLEVALLDVENVDNYVISGIVVHNSKPVDPI